jgi:hypothetical protein
VDGSFELRSAASGARIQLDGTGFKAFNSGGTQTVDIASTGNVLIIGEIRTANSGRRLVFNPSGASDPEIRFHADTGSAFVRMYSVATGTGEPEVKILGAVGANGRTPEFFMGSGFCHFKNFGGSDPDSYITLDAGGGVTIGDKDVNLGGGTGNVQMRGHLTVINNDSPIAAGKIAASGVGGTIFYGVTYNSTPYPAAMVRAGNTAAFVITGVSSDSFGWSWAGPNLSSGSDHINWFGRKE